MDYGEIIKRGWRVTWENKFLWLLGFIAALGGSGGSGGNVNFNGNFPVSGSGGSGSSSSSASPLDPETTAQVERWLSDETLWAQIGTIVFVFVCCFTLFFVVLWFLRLAAEAGMIRAVVEIEQGQKMSFGQAFSAGSQYLGKLFGVNMVLKFLPWLAFMGLFVCGFFAVGGSAIFSAIGSNEPNLVAEELITALGALTFVLFCVGCFYAIFLLVVRFVYPFAQRGVVLKGLGVMDSIRHGWRVLKKNFAEIFLLGLLFVAIGIAVSMVVAMFVLPIVFISFMPLGMALFESGTASPALFVMGGLGIVAAMVLGSLINSVMIAFRSSTFTLAYLEFEDGKKLS